MFEAWGRSWLELNRSRSGCWELVFKPFYYNCFHNFPLDFFTLGHAIFCWCKYIGLEVISRSSFNCCLVWKEEQWYFSYEYICLYICRCVLVCVWATWMMLGVVKIHMKTWLTKERQIEKYQDKHLRMIFLPAMFPHVWIPADTPLCYGSFSIWFLLFQNHLEEYWISSLF